MLSRINDKIADIMCPCMSQTCFEKAAIHDLVSHEERSDKTMSLKFLLSSMVLLVIVKFSLSRSIFRGGQTIDKKTLKLFLSSTNDFTLEDSSDGISIKIKTESLKDFLEQEKTLTANIENNEETNDGVQHMIRENSFSRIT